MSRDGGDIICLVTARGASRGVPRKNVAKVGGIPLVCRAVDAMLAAQRPDYCFVSTDDDEIAELCRERGANVPFKRPAELARDDTPQYPVLQHAIRWYEEVFNRRVEILCFLQPTAPFILSEDIDRCIDAALGDPQCTAAISFVEARHNPYFVLWEEINGHLQPLMRERGYDRPIEGKAKRLLRRQDAPPVLQAAGMVWATKRFAIMNLDSAYGPHPIPVVVDAERFCEIDHPMDLALAQAQHKYLIESGKLSQ